MKCWVCDMSPLLVTLVTVGGVCIGHFYSRLNVMENELKAARSYNRVMWLWARNQLELYYQYRQEGAPDPIPIPEEK